MACDAPEDLGNSSSSATKSQIGIKKGPWTATEDMILVDYVKKHGEGNWNAVQQNSGLMRCGKSCRLRWANHLRPNLKKGAFSVEEEKLIVQLHAKLGNKWARMAAQLPGRTDNEIKNYWNTRLKRRQRAGLPIYPQDVLENQQPLNSSPLLVSSESPNPYTSPFNFSPNSILPLETNKPRLNLCQANTGNLGLHLATSDSSLPPSPPPTLRHNNALAMNYSFLGYNSNPLSYKILELPLIQSPGTTIDSSSDVQSAAAELGFSRTGLLGDLFGESKGLVRTRKFEKEFIPTVGNYGVNGNDNENASANCNKNEGNEITSALGKGISPIEDDLLRELLNNFPMSVPIPEWNDGQYAGSESSIMVNGATALAQVQPLGSTYNSPPEGK